MSLSLPRMFSEFSLKCLYFHHVCKKLPNLWSSHSWKMHWIETFLLMHRFTWNFPPSSCHHALYGEGKYLFPEAAFCRKSASLISRKGWRKLRFALSKFHQKILRWLGTLGFLYFVWFAIFQMWWIYSFVNNIYHTVWYKF